MATDRPIGFWLKLVDRLIDERFDRNLQTLTVTRRGWQVLNVLDRSASTRAEIDAAVAPFVGRAEEPSTAPAVDDLIGRGWARDVDGTIELTDDGRAARQRLAQVVGATRQQLMENVSADEYQATVGVLERLARNLGWDG